MNEMNDMNELDVFLTDYFENYAQRAVDNNDYDSQVADKIVYNKKAIKAKLRDYITDNFEVRSHIVREISNSVFDSIEPDDFSDIYVGNCYDELKYIVVAFPLYELSVEIPKDLQHIKSEYFSTLHEHAYYPNDNVIIYRIDTKILDSYINDAIEELADFE